MTDNYCDTEAMKRILSDVWDGTAVQYLSKYEIEKTAMSNLLLQRLEIPDKSVLLVQNCQQSRRMSRSKSTSSTLFIDDVSDEESELELTGCPLEWPLEPKSFSLLESPPYEDANKNSNPSLSDRLRPIPADEARSLLYAVVNTLSSCGSKNEIPPVWVVCDGMDPQYTAYLGYHKGGGTCSRAVVTCRGPVESKEDLPTFGCIQRKHFWGMSQSHSHTTMQVNARYNILRHYDPLCTSNGEEVMLIECSWNKTVTLLQPPLPDAICNLTIQIVPGNDRSPTRSLFKELAYLKRLVDSLKSGEVVWVPDMNGSSIMEKTKTLLKGTRKGSIRKKSGGGPVVDIGWDSVDFDLCIETVVIGKRQNMDFTDELWGALTGHSTAANANQNRFKDGLSPLPFKRLAPCVNWKFLQLTSDSRQDSEESELMELGSRSSNLHLSHNPLHQSNKPSTASFQELKDALAFVFRSVQTGDIRPLILRKNFSTAGGIIREMCQQLRPEPSLEGNIPLKMLAEIGLLKLQRDYMNIFIGLELASNDQLAPFFLPPNDLSLAVSELYKLQSVLDMVMLCKTFLHLPIHYLSGYAREALKYFSSADHGVHIHKFKFPVKVPVVRVVLENIPPVEWTASIKSRQGNYTAHTITHISTTLPFEHLNGEKHDNTGHGPRDPDYYCTIISCTQDKLR